MSAVPTSSPELRQPIHPQLHHYASSAPESVVSFEDNNSIETLDEISSPLLSWPLTRQCARVIWPLQDPIEAQLFRFWVEKAADWWNITSSHKIFSDVVPKLALSNSMLLNAIFLVSSQHIQRFDASFPAKPYFYHERILQCLIPYLAEHGSIEDEAILVAAMLLRSFEEFHGMLSSFKPRHITFRRLLTIHSWYSRSDAFVNS